MRSQGSEIEVGLLTGCQDRPYAFGLAMALASKSVNVDVVGADQVDSPEFHITRNIIFSNLGFPNHRDTTLMARFSKLAKYYGRLVLYSAGSKPRILHILWNNKIEYLDRTLLMLYYKLCGKKIALTAHNVNQARRDGSDSLLNRVTLRMQYYFADHIFVHTEKMKLELSEEFGVRERAVTVIRHPVNDAFPDTDLTPVDAKRLLGIGEGEKAILFFGRIRPYKGLDQLLVAFQNLVARNHKYRLIIAGEPKKGSEDYLEQVKCMIARDFAPDQIISKIQFIPDEEAEVYLKAADVLVLPYKEIFQSGVLFLGYSYGLPVVATEVGSFREEVVAGQTGFLCRPNDPLALAEALETYFASDLYRDLKNRRRQIRDYAFANHSWDAVAELTRQAYVQLLERRSA